MFYKILSVVFALVLCSIPVFAADQSEELVYLCEEHNCLKPVGVSDAVCAVCLYGNSSDNYNLVDMDVSDSAISTFALLDPPIIVPGTTGASVDRGVFVSHNVASDVSLSDVWCSINDYREFGDGSMYSLSYSPSFGSYYFTLPSENDRVLLYPYFNVIYGTYWTTFEKDYSMQIVCRGLTSDGTYAELDNSIGSNYSIFVDGGSFWDGSNFSSVSQRSYYIITNSGYYADFFFSEHIDGWYNAWGNLSIATDLSGFRTPDGLQPYPFASAFDIYLSSVNSSGSCAYYRQNLLFDEPITTLEIRNLRYFGDHYDFANGDFPQGFYGGGVIPGYEGAWMDSQFGEGVNPELSGTASSVTDGVDSMLDFEAGIYEDLNRYKSEIDFGNYSIPDTLAASFGWLSNKFMGFFDSVPDLRPIILFPAYLAIVVAIVHGIGNVGASLSGVARRQHRIQDRKADNE